MYDNTANIKDYVTLFLTEADEKPAVLQNGNFEAGAFTWRIPTTYYTNQRSTVCTVSIVNANLTSGDTHTSVLINYLNGGVNIYSKNQKYIIGHAFVSDHTNKAFYIDDSKIKLLTNARPDKITLDFIKETDGKSKSMATGSITLEFCYYNSESTNANYHNQFTNSLK